MKQREAPRQRTNSITTRLRDVAALAIIALVGGMYLAWGHTDRIGLLTGDGPNYLMMAKSYAHAGSNRVAAEAAAVSRFPPLYPLLLARTGGADSLPAAHIATISFFILALVALYAWQRLSGLPCDVSLMLMLAVSSVPDIWLSALTIQSEYQYLMLSLAAIALLAAYRRDRRDGLLYGAAIAIVLAILTRTIGIVLLLPFLVALWKTPWRQRGLAMAIVVLPVGLWYALHHAQHGGYTSVLVDYFGGRPATEFPALLVQQVATLRSGLSKALLLHPAYLSPLADIIGLVFVSAAILRAIQCEPDGIYACSYLALLVFWPFPGDAHRLIWPVLPLALVQPVLVARDVAGRHSPEATSRIAAVVCAATVFAMALPSISHAWARSRDPAAAAIPGGAADPVWYWSERSQAVRFASAERGLVEALRRVRTLVPEGDCVISIRPDWVNFYADRRSEAPLPDYAPDAAFGNAIKASGCRYVFMSPFLDRMYSKPMYPLERIAGNVTIIDRSSAPGASETESSVQFILAQYNP